ncbi:rho GTPase-activating protein 21 isoform X1 [Biomphalaria glabrata]|nr:rho GTPase-activating protein 21 isoform X1 [Biomphalaria glabrata]
MLVLILNGLKKTGRDGTQESRLSGSDSLLDWTGPHTIFIPRGAEGGFGFTLRHFVVYPPQSVLDSTDEQNTSSKTKGPYPRLCREWSLEPQDTIFVKSVKEASPAYYAGLNTGDRIIAVNGDSISGKSYRDVIAAIHHSGSTLKLLVVPKDEDILQMAYQSQTGDSMYSSTSSLADSRLSSHSQNLNVASSVGDLRTDGQAGHNKVKDFVYHQTSAQSKETSPAMTTNVTCSIQGKSKYSFGLYFPPKSGAAMNEPGTMGVSESNYDETSASHGVRKPVVSYRKTSLDESAALSASAKSREYFIRYSSDKAASDQRHRYSPRHSAYERYSCDNTKPTYIISRSQTVSAISPSQDSNKQYTSESGSSDSVDQRGVGVSVYSGGSHQSDSNSGSQTIVVHIPVEQHKVTRVSEPLRPSYGTTFALTRSPNTTHIEIQKSIVKPIVSQRKFQFESGRNENTPPVLPSGHNRYKTEIEKIRTQPKFSSIAMRKASFEQSPDRDPPGYEDENPEDRTGPSVETAQPTIKVRKMSSEPFNVSPHPIDRCTVPSNIPIRIYMTPSGSSVDIYTLDNSKNRLSQELSHTLKSSPEVFQYSPSASLSGPTGCETGTSGLADSGVWVKSYHSSSDMVDSVDSSGDHGNMPVVTAAESEVNQISRPARKSSYLSAVNAPRSSSPKSESPSGVDSRTSVVQGPPSHVAQSQTLATPESSVVNANPPRIFVQTNYMTDNQSMSSMGSSHSLSSLSSGSLPVASSVISSNNGTNLNVPMRKKLPAESIEDQASKLHRRTSYLMATARDRTNVVPIEKAFSPPQLVTDHRIQPSVGSSAGVSPGGVSSTGSSLTGSSSSGSPVTGVSAIKHQNSIKLNKFFGENIPSIAESMEVKVSEQEEVPEVIRKGPLTCKVSVIEGKKCSDRSWKSVYAILRQTEMLLMREKEGNTTLHEDHHIPLKSCMVESARDYAKKKKNVFRLSTFNECEYLFQTEDRGTMLCWIQAIKSINEPEKAEKMEEMIASEREKTLQTNIEAGSSKMSPQMGQKVKKLSALSFKSKLTSSPSMRRKKSNASEKDKDESLKKGWKGRLPMMKSLKKHNEEPSLSSLTEQEVDNDKMQFGVHLEDCFPSPHNEFVPLIVELCTRIVEARGLEVVGVYRVPGNSAAVNALTEEFNRGIDTVNIDNEKLLDINVISSLLKSFFRKLPEPLIPADMYDAFIEANRYPDEDKRKLKIKRLLHLLPQHNNETFKHMAEHLNKVASYGNINKMDAKNLAIMFGPTLIRKKGDDTVSLVTDMSDQCRIVESIILHHEWFFSAWDQDNYIPMFTTVETVNVDDGQSVLKDDDEEADSAISAKQIISSIVGAASRKLRNQQAQSNDSLDMVDTCSLATTSSTTFNLDSTSRTKSLSSIASSRSASEEYLERKSSSRQMDIRKAAPIANSEPDLMEFEYADATSPTSLNFSRHFSDDSLTDKNDELEISHGLPSSLSRDAIHQTLKRIGNDVSTLLHTFEQKQLKDRERRRWQQEMIEREHLRTQLELEQEENHSVEDWLAWKGSLPVSRMPDLVSSSYLGPTYPYEETKFKSSAESKIETKRVAPQSLSLAPQQNQITRVGSHEDILSQTKFQKYDAGHSVTLRGQIKHKPPENVNKSFQTSTGIDKISNRPSSVRTSSNRRHGSLDSLIDMIEKQEKRASWASTDSEDGSDLLTSITTTFDQKLQILLNPKYKLTGRKTDPFNADHPKEISVNSSDSQKSRNSSTSYSFLDSTEKSFRDPSLHRSAKSDPKIGIASRFERNDSSRVSPVSMILSETSNLTQPKKNQFPDFKSFLTQSHGTDQQVPVVLTQPKKLDTSPRSTGVKKIEVKSQTSSSPRQEIINTLTNKNTYHLDNKENRKSHKRRRHTVGGMEDFDHMVALTRACADISQQRLSAWEQLRPAVKEDMPPGDMQTWIHKERLRGSTPDLSLSSSTGN